jgi:hypothetical protein
VILFAEKDGRFALVREIAQAYDATALALGGYPSSRATEYLVHALQHAGVLAERPALQLFSVVDYDPSGYWIAREFTAQLHAFGVQEVTLHPLIRPERFTTEQVALGRYTLPKGSKTTNWVRETGGLMASPTVWKRMSSPRTSSAPPLSRQPPHTCARCARSTGSAPC